MKTCAACSMKNLEWVELNGKWKLYEANGRLHVCTGIFSRAVAPKISACRHGILRINWCDLCEEERDRR